MWLIAGLGNPGRRYEKNRHNIGFRVVDELARRHVPGGFRSKFGGETASGLFRHHKIVLLKPMEFMNLSGNAVQRAAKFYDATAEQIIIVHDEIDLPFGRVRLKAGGGHGGHNGLRSIVSQLGSRDFLRVRVGVDKPTKTTGGPGDGAVSNHVLSDFSSAEASEVDALTDRAADAVEAILERGLPAAMNEFHGAS